MLKFRSKIFPQFQKIFEYLENNNNYKDVKLVSTFLDRKEYVVHFKNLKLYLKLGMKLKKIHRVLKFRQSNFIAPFSEKCTLARQNATTIFEKISKKDSEQCVW